MTVTYSAAPVLRWGLLTGHFTVAEAFTATWARPGKKLFKVRVAQGFGTDLASIPRLFQNIVPKIGRHIQPAIVHDFTYVYDTGLTKKEADAMFLDGMKSVGVAWLRRRVMWLAIRIGGTGRWG